VALHTEAGAWSAVLLCGPPGSGKSDLALRLLSRRASHDARLVSDDYVNLRREQDALIASAPAAIAGLLEVRGLGVVERQTLHQATVVLAFDLSVTARTERLPEPAWLDLGTLTAGLQIPVYAINPFQVSAEAKVIVTHAAVTGQCRLVGFEGKIGS